MNVFTEDKRPIVLERVVARGGEGRIFTIGGRQDLVAKVYDRPPSPDVAAKLRWMLAHRPTETATAPGHVALAWPTNLLFDEFQHLVGFMMPYIGGAVTAFDVYNRRRRNELGLGLAPAFPYVVGRNLAAAVGSLHAADYVVGDLNESNVLVTRSALVTLIDVDSFQVTARPAGGPPRVYRCPVGKVEYTAPELQGQDFASIDRSAEHDRFALGVLIFQLLMDGNHPFRGRWLPAGAPPELPTKIAAGYFPYRKQRRGKIVPPLGAPSLDALHPAVAKLVRRCFVEGHKDPRRRPMAEEWRDALDRAAAAGVRSTPTVAPPRPLPRPPTVRGHPHQGPPKPVPPPRPVPTRSPRRRDDGPRWLRRTLAVCAVPAVAWVSWMSLSGGDLDLPSREWCSLAPFVACTDDETPTPTPELRILVIVCCPPGVTSVAIRRVPGWDSPFALQDLFPDGTRVELLDGPRMVEGQAWFRVRVLSNGHQGWVADEQVRAPIEAR